MTVASMLTKAAEFIGYTERGRRFVEWFGSPIGTAWCAIFVSYCAAHSGNEAAFPRFQYTPTGAAWFKQQSGGWHTKNPQPGDLVFYDFPDDVHRIQHVGIVEKVLADGRIQTIEGNTSTGATGSQSNGGTVARRTRETRYVVGYGRPNYPTPTARSVPMSMPTVNLADAHVKPVTGPGVKQLQALLLVAGYGPNGLVSPTGFPDGNAGTKTRAYLGDFQQRRGLVKDWTAGVKTWAALLGIPA